jgi:hypothetical protein
MPGSGVTDERGATLRARDPNTSPLDLHLYTVPGFVALPGAAGHAPYLTWISESVTTKGGGTADQE